MGFGICGEALCDEIHGRLEGHLLSGAIMAPELPERRLITLQKRESEEIFKAALEQRIAFHVEEEIAGARPRQSRESLAVNGRHQLVAVLAVAALAVLQSRLGAQPLQRIRLQAGDRGCRRKRRELRHRCHARRVELLDLSAGDAGHETQVVGCRPFSLAALPPAAQTTGTAGLARRLLRYGGDEGLKALAGAGEVVPEVPSG